MYSNGYNGFGAGANAYIMQRPFAKRWPFFAALTVFSIREKLCKFLALILQELYELEVGIRHTISVIPRKATGSFVQKFKTTSNDTNG